MIARRVCVAGYMGSGKSTASRLLAEFMGAGIIDADIEAKEFMRGDATVKRQLAEAFGATVLDNDDIVFGELGRIVFCCAESLSRLNAIVHPPLFGRLRELLDAADGPMILDAALVPLWHLESWFDLCLWIHAAPEIRLQRLIAKGTDASVARKRMRLQEATMPAPEESPWVRIVNEGTVGELGEALTEALLGT